MYSSIFDARMTTKTVYDKQKRTIEAAIIILNETPNFLFLKE
jgi:hypothetical protein